MSSTVARGCHVDAGAECSPVAAAGAGVAAGAGAGAAARGSGLKVRPREPSAARVSQPESQVRAAPVLRPVRPEAQAFWLTATASIDSSNPGVGMPLA
jgi:hypothetical protein